MQIIHPSFDGIVEGIKHVLVPFLLLLETIFITTTFWRKSSSGFSSEKQLVRLATIDG